MTESEKRPTRTSTPWLAGLMLGVVVGLTTISFALGILGIPILVGSLILIVWKGPRMIAFTGLVTGVGLVWLFLFGRLALTCGGPLDLDPNTTCGAGDLTGAIVVSAVVLALGLAGSAFAFRRARGS